MPIDPLEYFFLPEVNKISDYETYLNSCEFLNAQEQIVSLAKAGEGNMNLTLRCSTDHRSFILKQSRPFVEKYPSIPAPADRILVEKEFYDLVQEDDVLAHVTPRILFFDTDNRIIIMEDLGNAPDMSFIYKSGNDLDSAKLDQLISILERLHTLPVGKEDDRLVNMEMRQLNHAHMFEIPFRADNGLDLDAITDGLSGLATELYHDVQLKRVFKDFADLYLKNGDHLLHGDFYPGSWLWNDLQIFIIDPEFSFHGPMEFDWGIFLAHLRLAGDSSAERHLSDCLTVRSLNQVIMEGFASIEILRRIFGVAQLPLDMSFSQKESLVRDAIHKLKTLCL